MVPDSESAVGAMRTCHEGGHCGDNMHHLCAQAVGAKCLAPKAAINIVIAQSHWITAINVRVDVATKEEPQADLT